MRGPWGRRVGREVFDLQDGSLLISISLPGETSPSQFREILESTAPPQYPNPRELKACLGERGKAPSGMGAWTPKWIRDHIWGGLARGGFLREDPYPPLFPGSPLSKHRFTVSGQPVGTAGSGVPPLNWLQVCFSRLQDGVGQSHLGADPESPTAGPPGCPSLPGGRAGDPCGINPSPSCWT